MSALRVLLDFPGTYSPPGQKISHLASVRRESDRPQFIGGLTRET